MKKVFLVCLLFCMISSLYTNTEVKDYDNNEFPQWALKLRRAEIIAFGVYPFAYFFTNFSYSFYRWYSNDFDSLYRPGLLANPLSPPLSNQEKTTILAFSVVSAISFSFIDFLLGEFQGSD